MKHCHRPDRFSLHQYFVRGLCVRNPEGGYRTTIRGWSASSTMLLGSRRSLGHTYHFLVQHKKASHTKDETGLVKFRLTCLSICFFLLTLSRYSPSDIYEYELTSQQFKHLASLAILLFRLLFPGLSHDMSFSIKWFPTLLLTYYRILIACGSCYNPDQSVPIRPYSPCDTVSGVHSACCAPGDPCTANGYCFGSAGYLYRGGCTDITWQSPNCCPKCRDSTQSAKTPRMH